MSDSKLITPPRAHCELKAGNSRQRNYAIDIFKLICALFVITLHVNTPYHDLVTPITRCAVPCFFMISGYYMMGASPEKIRKTAIRIFKIYIISFLIYFVPCIVHDVMLNTDYFISRFHILNFLILGENPIAIPLWYMGAYTWVLFVVYFVSKKNVWRQFFILAPFLLVGCQLIGEFGSHFCGTVIPGSYTRNFLFMGLPYFAIGGLIRFFGLVKKSYRYVYLLAFIAFCIISHFERTYVVASYFPLKVDINNFFGTIGASVALFLFFFSIDIPKPSFLSRIGSRHTLYIYLFHGAIMGILLKIVVMLPQNDSLTIVYSWLCPFINMVICSIVVELGLKIWKNLRFSKETHLVKRDNSIG